MGLCRMVQHRPYFWERLFAHVAGRNYIPIKVASKLVFNHIALGIVLRGQQRGNPYFGEYLIGRAWEAVFVQHIVAEHDAARTGNDTIKFRSESSGRELVEEIVWVGIVAAPELNFLAEG